MKKTIIWGIILAFAALIVFNYIMPSCLRQQQTKISNLTEILGHLKRENRPLAFMVSARTDSTVSVNLKFYDLNKKEVASVSETLKGSELFFDFESYKTDSLYLAFPSKLFTNYIPAEKGISLFHFYDKAGLPLIYSSDGVSIDYQNAFKKIFKEVKDSLNTDKSFGNAVHDIENLKHFEIGQEYEIITHTKGGIEIIEN